MKTMNKEEFQELHSQVHEGDVLIVPRDMELDHNKYRDALYEVFVTNVDGDGFHTDLVEGSYQNPLRWSENYNFKGAKIK